MVELPKLDDRAVVEQTPQRFRLVFALWTAAMVQALLLERFGGRLSRSPVTRLLAQLSLLAQRPLWQAYQQNPKAVRQWLAKEYPALQRRAMRVGTRFLLRMVGRMRPTECAPTIPAAPSGVGMGSLWPSLAPTLTLGLTWSLRRVLAASGAS